MMSDLVDREIALDEITLDLELQYPNFKITGEAISFLNSLGKEMGYK